MLAYKVLEEEVVEAHRNMVDGLEVWRQQDAILLAMTNAVDYDQEAYAQLLEEMVREKQEVLADLALKARAFRECLTEEEAEASHRRGCLDPVGCCAGHASPGAP